MLHRPTLMPASMKSSSKLNLSTNSKHSSQSIKMESPELIQLLNCGDDDDEIVIVEPTDPDEDRMKQEDTTFNDVLNKEQENYAEEDYNGNDGDMNSDDSHMKSESHIPVSNIKVDEVTGNGTPVTVTTDSVKPIGILPLNDVIHNLLTCTPHVAPTIQNVALQPILSGKMNGSGSVQMPNVVSNALPTLWLHSPVVNSTEMMSMPNVNSVTDLTSNIVQNSGTALNPLVAAVLVNCATVNMISQLAGSMCTPMVNSSIIDGNVNGSNVYNNSEHTSSACSVSVGSSGVNTVTIPTASLFPNLLSAIPLSTYISGLGLNTTGGIITSPNSLCNVGVTSTAVSSAATLNTNSNNNNNIGGIIVTPSIVENIMVSLSSGRNQAKSDNLLYNIGKFDVNDSVGNVLKSNTINRLTLTDTESSVVVPFPTVSSSINSTKELRKYHCTYPECNKSYTRRYRLNLHISTHTDTGPISCDTPKCNVKCFSEEDLKRHKLSQHSSVDKDSRRRHACTFPGCSRSYSELNRLEEHLRTHSGERPYVCRKPGCGATFARLSGVKSHELTHVYVRKSSKRLAQYPITMVGNIFGTSFDTSEPILNNQGSSEITTISPHALPKSTESIEITSEISITPNIYKNRTLPLIAPKSSAPLLKPSIPTVSWDSGMKLPHICPFKECGKAFLKRNKLRDHIYRHTGVRPFVCDQCNASFVQRYELRCHTYVHLRGARPSN
uniref:Zinc finger protein 143 n=1 Tax=Schistosoma haematobium TaxID=6185 RepID=A0A095C9S0_SCHHA